MIVSFKMRLQNQNLRRIKQIMLIMSLKIFLKIQQCIWEKVLNQNQTLMRTLRCWSLTLRVVQAEKESSVKEHLVDALALGGDEGRNTLR